MSWYKIQHDDCLHMMAGLQPNSIDLLLTDPPYNLGLFMKERATNLKQMRPNYFGSAGWDNIKFGEWRKSMDDFFRASSFVMKEGGSMVIFMSIIKVETIIQLATQYGFYYKTTGIWHKLNPMPRNMNLHFINSTEAWIYFPFRSRTGTFNNNGKAIHDFCESSVTPASEKKFGKHPTQKPETLLKPFISLLSNEHDVVCDPFMGSGSTGVAALTLGRNFIGSELNHDYFKICKQRLSFWEEINVHTNNH